MEKPVVGFFHMIILEEDFYLRSMITSEKFGKKMSHGNDKNPGGSGLTGDSGWVTLTLNY
jgi:hypothetical protein